MINNNIAIIIKVIPIMPETNFNMLSAANKELIINTIMPIIKRNIPILPKSFPC